MSSKAVMFKASPLAASRQLKVSDGSSKMSVTALEETHPVGDSAGLREHWH